VRRCPFSLSPKKVLVAAVCAPPVVFCGGLFRPLHNRAQIFPGHLRTFVSDVRRAPSSSRFSPFFYHASNLSIEVPSPFIFSSLYHSSNGRTSNSLLVELAALAFRFVQGLCFNASKFSNSRPDSFSTFVLVSSIYPAFSWSQTVTIPHPSPPWRLFLLAKSEAPSRCRIFSSRSD